MKTFTVEIDGAFEMDDAFVQALLAQAQQHTCSMGYEVQTSRRGKQTTVLEFPYSRALMSAVMKMEWPAGVGLVDKYALADILSLPPRRKGAGRSHTLN